MTAIFKDTESVVNTLASVNLLQKIIMGRKYENQLNSLIRRLNQLSKSAMFQDLVSIMIESSEIIRLNSGSTGRGGPTAPLTPNTSSILYKEIWAPEMY